MQDLEPYYQWLHIYNSAEDPVSPFYNVEHSEFEYTHTIYNFVLHPQWDSFGSSTLYLKILFVDYEKSYTIIELIGEWNDTIHNDIMMFKREVIELLTGNGINKFILVGENVMNFHSSDDSYYEEWFADIEDGWIALVNFREHVLSEFESCNLDYYLNFGGDLDDMIWRHHTPIQFYKKVEELLTKRLY
ncbi:MAG: hypothetical protein HQ463_03640 [Bacteroidetes bacterium]|nr:hypothetical protein [Bacteroidota bacterium]